MRPRVLIAVVFLPFALWTLLPVQAAGRGELERRIDAARAKIDKKEARERVLASDIAAYTEQIRALDGRIGRLLRRQRLLEDDLEDKRAALMATQARLRSERARLARLRARLVVSRRALAKRVVEIYKADKPDVLTVVLNSNGFADLLSRQEFIARIAEQDRRIVSVVRDAKREAEATEERLDALERRQQRVTDQVLARRNEVALVKEELAGTRTRYERTRTGRRRVLGKVRVARRGLERHLDGLEAEQAKVRARLASVSRGRGGAPPVRGGSGRLIWPASGPLSSGFGPRWGRLHAGVDMPLPEGTSLRAAAAGRVAIAGPTGGYGNYTCIQHTGSLSTCYAHQSSIGVSVGQSVAQGQVIGRSGNTGNSTGPHLHFEVRLGGGPVDPLGYL